MALQITPRVLAAISGFLRLLQLVFTWQEAGNYSVAVDSVAFDRDAFSKTMSCLILPFALAAIMALAAGAP